MNTTKRRVVNTKLVASEFCNGETGEVLSSLGGNNISIRIVETTEVIEISCKNFVTLPSVAIGYLKDTLTISEIGRVVLMADLARTKYCILMNGNNFPHTSETLAQYLEIHLDNFYRLVKELKKAGLLVYEKTPYMNLPQKVYMLNPYGSRKRTGVDSSTLQHFKDITRKS